MSQENIDLVRRSFDVWERKRHGCLRRTSCIFTLSGRQMQRMEFFFDHAEAVRAMGLPE